MIIVQVVLSWLFAFNVLNVQLGRRAHLHGRDRPHHRAALRPIRRLMPDFGGIYFSPLVVLILIQVIKKLLAGVAQYYRVG